MLEIKELAVEIKNLYESGQYIELLSVATHAANRGVFFEELYVYVLKSLEQLKMYKVAVSMYYRAQLEFEKNGFAFPNEEIKTVYENAVEKIGVNEAYLLNIKEDLKKTTRENKKMATSSFYCSYEVFKYVYSIMARTAERTGQVISILLVSFIQENEADSEEKLSETMKKAYKILGEGALRKSDVFTQSSNNKFIIALSTDRSSGAVLAAKRLEKTLNKEFDGQGVKIEINISETD